MKKKKEKLNTSKINDYNILGISVQGILTLVVCIFGILTLILGSKFLKFLYLFIGLDLLILAYNNKYVFHKDGLTIMYLSSGVALTIYSILMIVGVL